MINRTSKINKITKIKGLFNKVQNTSALKFLIVSNITLFAAYLFFVGATTVQVVNRKNVEESTRVLQSSRASLEEAYNDSSKMYTKDYAKTLGFIEAIPMFYATKSSVSTVAYGTAR